jgi:hypothetical protein
MKISRADEAFVDLNCAGRPENFWKPNYGHEKALSLAPPRLAGSL